MQNTLPVVIVNGVKGAQLSPLDRGFAYGDGVFETCKMQNGKIPLWDLHKDRLTSSCEKLLIPVAFELIETQLKDAIRRIVNIGVNTAVVKITVTRGEGGRGYRAPDAINPTIVIAIFPESSYPETYYTTGVTIKLCRQRLGLNPGLAGLKHLNRLEQILARAEWQDEAIAEGLLLDTDGHVVEGVSSNIFLIQQGHLITPDLSHAGVAGIMRRLLIETIAPIKGLNVTVKKLALADVLNADAIFLCNSLHGIWPVHQLVADEIHTYAPHPLICELQLSISETLAVF